MSIFDFDDNSTLDISAARLALNLEVNERRSALLESLSQTVSGATDRLMHIKNGYRFAIDDTGCMCVRIVDANLLNVDAPIVLRDEILRQYIEDGVITGIRASEFQVAYSDVTNLVAPTNIIARKFYVMRARKVSGMHVDLDGRVRANSGQGVSAMFDNCPGLAFEDTTINFTNTPEQNQLQLNFHACKNTDLHGLTSNCTCIRFYELDGDRWPVQLNNMFTFTPCSIYDIEKRCNVEMPVKNIKKAIAIANNDKRYRLNSHILQFVEGAKMSDLLPVENFSCLNEVIIENNNVTFRFVKEGSGKDRVASYSRIPIDASRDMSRYIKTEDGWYLQIIKRA